MLACIPALSSFSDIPLGASWDGDLVSRFMMGRIWVICLIWDSNLITYPPSEQAIPSLQRHTESRPSSMADLCDAQLHVSGSGRRRAEVDCMASSTLHDSSSHESKC